MTMEMSPRISSRKPVSSRMSKTDLDAVRLYFPDRTSGPCWPEHPALLST
jgi:hypothetical protein